MTTSKRIETLDEVLAAYAKASAEFDATVLHTFVKEFPKYAQALQRYAHIQLISVPATPEEIASETLSAEELLPQQSRLLKRIHEQRRASSSPLASAISDKLSAIAGEIAMQSAATAIFGTHKHGEDLLLMSVIDSSTEISDVPNWFYESLGEYVGETPSALIAEMSMRQQQTIGAQRFSSKGKPVEPPSISWEQLVEDCITEDAVKRKILHHT